MVFPAHAMEDVDQARNLIRKMAVAHREQNYQGVFTYEHGGVLKAIRILHVIHNGLEYERLLYLNGPRKEVFRRGIPVDCKPSGDRFFHGVPASPSQGSHLEEHYELFLRGEDRVAGRMARVVHVVPKDEMRYGYILSIDKETGLLLQSLLVGTNRRVMERFQYVDLSLAPGDEIVASLIDSSQPMDVVECNVDSELKPVSWEAKWLPPGYRLVGTGQDEENSVSLNYSDGLSFVSVFIDAGKEERFPPIQAQRGATVAQLVTVNHKGRDYAICVVGEVPPETAGKIAQFVTPLD